jgi:signal transduction histidine kinase
MNSGLLLESVAALIGCKDLEGLASGTALLAQHVLGSSNAVVLLRSAEREFLGGAPGSSDELLGWAGEWLSASAQARQANLGGRQAASIDVPEHDVRGVLAVSFAQKDGSMVEERQSLLAKLAQLSATCGGQIVRSTLADRTLQDTRALMARGLHDLCTPLNSLRLGMHLLEPALTAKDPAIAQRAHRAVDRMAALVTTMAEALGPQVSSGQRGASVSSASQH